jgi:hypothetical protein
MRFVIKSVRLNFMAGNSDKEYRIELQQDGNTWRVEAFWGPRTNPRRSSGVKYEGRSKYEAEGVFSSFQEEKLRKGYTLTYGSTVIATDGRGAEPAPAAPAPRPTPRPASRPALPRKIKPSTEEVAAALDPLIAPGRAILFDGDSP